MGKSGIFKPVLRVDIHLDCKGFILAKKLGNWSKTSPQQQLRHCCKGFNVNIQCNSIPQSLCALKVLVCRMRLFLSHPEISGEARCFRKTAVEPWKDWRLPLGASIKNLFSKSRLNILRGVPTFGKICISKTSLGLLRNPFVCYCQTLW